MPFGLGWWKEKQMRIAILSWESLQSIAVGGVATHVSELAAAMAREGEEIHVVTRLGPGQRAYKLVDGVHYHRCAYDSRPDFVSDIDNMCRAFVDRLWQIEDYSGCIDAVHGHDWLTAKAAAWARAGRGKRVVMTFHSTEYGRAGNCFNEGLSRTIRDYEWHAQYESDAVIAVSNAVGEEVIRIYGTPRSKITVIYNGVNPRRFDGWVDPEKVKERCGVRAGRPMVLFVGRLVYQKGPDDLLDAIPLVLAPHPEARFVFVGEGDMRRSLEDRAAYLGVGHATRFLGWRGGEALVDIYRSADIVCVPSRNEPFGIVILEAWSAGKPVVASMNGGPGEFVWHGVTGLKTLTDPRSIAEALVFLLNDARLTRWMGHNGRVAVETTFSWDHIARRTRSVYRNLSKRG
jgi:glycosyltransferase involved in cell wall biosynthesis